MLCPVCGRGGGCDCDEVEFSRPTAISRLIDWMDSVSDESLAIFSLVVSLVAMALSVATWVFCR